MAEVLSPGFEAHNAELRKRHTEAIADLRGQIQELRTRVTTMPGPIRDHYGPVIESIEDRVALRETELRNNAGDILNHGPFDAGQPLAGLQNELNGIGTTFDTTAENMQRAERNRQQSAIPGQDLNRTQVIGPEPDRTQVIRPQQGNRGPETARPAQQEREAITKEMQALRRAIEPLRLRAGLIKTLGERDPDFRLEDAQRELLERVTADLTAYDTQLNPDARPHTPLSSQQIEAIRGQVDLREPIIGRLEAAAYVKKIQATRNSIVQLLGSYRGNVNNPFIRGNMDRLKVTEQNFALLASGIESSVSQEQKDRLDELIVETNDILQQLGITERTIQPTIEQTEGQRPAEQGEYQPGTAELNDVDRLIGSYLIDQMSPGEKRDYLEKQRQGREVSDRELIDNYLKEHKSESLDTLFREAAVRRRLDELTDDTVERSAKRQQELENSEKGGRWKKVLKAFGVTAGFTGAGILGGTIVRHLTQQGLIQLGLTGSHLIGGIGGLVAGAFVGGGIGLWKGYLKGRGEAESRIYKAEDIATEIRDLYNSGDIDEEGAVALYDRLLENKKLQGDVEGGMVIIRGIARQRADREFRIRLEGMKPVEGETPEQQRQRLARAMTELCHNRCSEGGSEADREKAITRFLDERRAAVKDEAWASGRKEAIKGAVTWSITGGIFGAVFSAPGIESAVHAKQVAAETAATNFQATDSSFKELISFVSEGGHSAAEIRQQAAEIIKEQVANGHQFNTGELLHALQIDNTENLELARQIGLEMHIDMNAVGPDGKSVLELAKAYGDIAPTDSAQAARGLFHLISHPQEVAADWTKFKTIVEGFGNITSGHDFTSRIIHGGTPWWQPFTGGAMQGGSMSDAISASAREYLVGQGDILKAPWPLTTETPWFPFLAFTLATASAKEAFKNGVERIKGVANKSKERGEKEKQLEKSIEKLDEEDRKKRPTTEIVKVDGRIFEKNLPEAEKQALEAKRAEFMKKLPTLHGKFFFKRGADGKTRAFRMWPLDTNVGNPRPAVDPNHPDTTRTPSMQTGARDLAETGQFMVKEYDIDTLYGVDSSGNRQDFTEFAPKTGSYEENKFDQSWDHPMWQPVKGKNGEDIQTVSAADIFNGSGSLEQTFISPYEADKYAFAIQKRGVSADGLPVEVDKLGEAAKATPTAPTTETPTDKPAPTPETGTKVVVNYESHLPTGMDPKSAEGLDYLAAITAATTEKKFRPFATGNPRGTWVVTTLRNLGWTVETKDDTVSGLTEVVSITEPKPSDTPPAPEPVPDNGDPKPDPDLKKAKLENAADLKPQAILGTVAPDGKSFQSKIKLVKREADGTWSYEYYDTTAKSWTRETTQTRRPDELVGKTLLIEPGIDSTTTTEKKLEDLPQTVDKLPTLPPGSQRLIYYVGQSSVDAVLKNGLDYAAQGSLNNTTRLLDHDAPDYYNGDTRYSKSNLRAIVIDLPDDQYALHSDATTAPGVLSPECIVGVVDAKEPERYDDGKIKTTIKDYLHYYDTADAAGKASIEKSIDAGEFRTGMPIMEEYAKSLLDLMDKPGEARLTTVATEIRTNYDETMRKLGLTSSETGTSRTWIYWDLAKQAFYAKHPSHPDANADKYPLVDATEDTPEAAARRQEIADRHVAWELSTYKKDKVVHGDPEFGWLADSTQGAEIQRRLTEAGTSTKNKGLLSSSELAQLGALVREAIDERDIKPELKVELFASTAFKDITSDVVDNDLAVGDILRNKVGAAGVAKTPLLYQITSRVDAGVTGDWTVTILRPDGSLQPDQKWKPGLVKNMHAGYQLYDKTLEPKPTPTTTI